MRSVLGKRMGLFVIAVALLLAGISRAPAASVTWGGGSGDWFTPGNWSGGSVPADGDSALINAGSVLLTNATPQLDSFIITNAVLTFTNWSTAIRATNVWVQKNATINCSGPFLTNGGFSNRVYIVCSNNFTLDATAAITVSGKGYAGANGTNGALNGYGPGGGQTVNRGGGGGYGGTGGNGSGPAAGGVSYGSASSPAPGSGGGGKWFDPVNRADGGHGGGLAWIQAAGTVTLNGSITANGTTGPGDSAGGGSGGGIYINGRSVQGSGSLSAVGGDGALLGGAGGGGRIALLFSYADLYAGSLAVGPGVDGFSAPAPHAQTGTLLRTYSGSGGLLLIQGNPANYGTPAPDPYGSTGHDPGVTITNQVPAVVVSATTGLQYNSIGWTLATNGVFAQSGSTTQAVFVVATTNLTLTWFWTNVCQLSTAVGPSGSVSGAGWYTNGTVVPVVATPDPGYAFLQWTGDVDPPQYTNATMNLTMNMPRTVQANFRNTAFAGTRTWNGTGNWATPANWSPQGMPGTFDSAVLQSGTCTMNFPVSLISVLISNSATLGIYLTNAWGAAAIVDLATNLTISTNGIMHVYAGPTNGAAAYGALVRVGQTMTLLTNAWVYPHSDATNGGSVMFRVSNLSVPSWNSGFNAAAFGYSGGIPGHVNGFGPGFAVGGFSPIPGGGVIRGGGGGYGGPGGKGADASPGGTNYGVAARPVDPGSGGGAKQFGVPGGGAAGGLIWIDAARTVLIEGSLLADGAGGAADSSGGGSGGGIYLTCRTLQGAKASLSASGGAGALYGGGAGGGRIAVWSMFNLATTNGWNFNVLGGAAGGIAGTVAGSNGTLVWGSIPVPEPGVLIQLR